MTGTHFSQIWGPADLVSAEGSLSPGQHLAATSSRGRRDGRGWQSPHGLVTSRGPHLPMPSSWGKFQFQGFEGTHTQATTVLSVALAAHQPSGEALRLRPGRP